MEHFFLHWISLWRLSGCWSIWHCSRFPVTSSNYTNALLSVILIYCRFSCWRHWLVCTSKSERELGDVARHQLVEAKEETKHDLFRDDKRSTRCELLIVPFATSSDAFLFSSRCFYLVFKKVVRKFFAFVWIFMLEELFVDDVYIFYCCWNEL